MVTSNRFYISLKVEIRKGRVEDIVGDSEMRINNEQDDRFMELCQEQDVAIITTFCKLHERLLYTWKS